MLNVRDSVTEDSRPIRNVTDSAGDPLRSALRSREGVGLEFEFKIAFVNVLVG